MKIIKNNLVISLYKRKSLWYYFKIIGNIKKKNNCRRFPPHRPEKTNQLCTCFTPYRIKKKNNSSLYMFHSL